MVAAVGKHSAPVHKITIIPRTSGALGYTLQIDEQEKVLMTREEAIDKITTYTGGRAAEEVIFNIKTSGASNDIEMATKIARSMVTRFGMNDEIGMVALETVNNAYLGGDTSLVCSPETSSQIDKEVVKIVKSCHDRAVSILSDNIDKLHEISAYLLKHETITGEEFMDILNDEYKITTKAINKAEEQMVDDNSVTENSNEIFHVDSLELENDGSELEKTKNKMEDYDV